MIILNINIEYVLFYLVTWQKNVKIFVVSLVMSTPKLPQSIMKCSRYTDRLLHYTDSSSITACSHHKFFKDTESEVYLLCLLSLLYNVNTVTSVNEILCLKKCVMCAVSHF